jgi:hypothetical protein
MKRGKAPRVPEYLQHIVDAIDRASGYRTPILRNSTPMFLGTRYMVCAIALFMTILK